MCSTTYCFTVLLILVVSLREAELQPTFTAEPSNPFNVLEGNDISLEWSYDLGDGGSFQRIDFELLGSASTVPVVEVSTVGETPSFTGPNYLGRVKVNVTDIQAAITILGAKRTDSGNHQLKVIRNPDGARTTITVEIVVQYPPEFTSVSSDRTVVEGDGDSVILECDAVGEPTNISISWTRVFDNGSDSSVLSNGNQLVLDNNRNAAGAYRCTADNGIGTAPNRTINVDVNYKPENIMFMIDSNVCKGDTINISCSADGKPAVHTYQLFKNNMLVSESSSGVWNRTMSAEGEFNYTCVANNTVGTSGKNESVTVNVPSKVYPLKNITVTEGDNTTLTCNVSGSPVLSVTWTAVDTGDRSVGITRDLTNINRNDAGEYKCEASNSCGNDTESIFLTVQYPPENLQFAASKETICEGEVISFTCSADGNPAVHTYQLFENDTLVSDGSNSDGMWNRNMSVGGVFIYKCVANNTVGTQPSLSVNITVNVPSSIEAIQNKTVTEGENVTLSCQASGTPTPMVYWIKADGQRIDESELVITNISKNEAGEYRCEASNECGNASETAHVEVQYPPENVQLNTSAVNDKACQGDIISISCSADANPSVTSYELFENDTAILGTSESGTWSKNFTSGGVFIYNCVANNSLGTEQSSSVTVTVNVPSSIEEIQNKTVTEGENVTLSCRASGTPTPMVYWIKADGQRIDGSELVLTNISRNEAGEYRCEASNECHNASEAAHIDVHYPPDNLQLETSAVNDKACQGDIISITCSADANPSVTSYELFENDTAILDTSESGTRSKNFTSGGVFIYKCVANNSVGTQQSSSVTINVNVPSSIEAIHNKTVTEGENVTLSCQASGTPTPMVYWIKADGQRIDESELVLTNISRDEAGEYRCEASNECGNASETAHIDVQYPPENVQLQTSAVNNKACQGDNISITCSADANPSVTSYELFENDTAILDTSESGTWSKNFTSGGVFIYKCVANNSLGTQQSASVSINVNVPSSIVAIQTETVTEGENVTLSCQASGTPTPMVYWIKADGQRIDIRELVLTNISRNEAGEYRCEASNECDNASETATVNVQYGPEITYISGEQFLNKGVSVTLNCTANGYPPPTITWTKVSDNSPVSFPLSITSKVNGGLYRCMADNGVGSPVTKEVNIVVHYPSAIEPLTDKTVMKGNNVTLYCNASGTPTPSVSWTHVETGKKRFSKTWVITNIKVENLGEYKCEASNEYGNDTKTTLVYFAGGKCEKKCEVKETCREVGRFFACLCPPGKKGTDCGQDEEQQKTVKAGFEFQKDFKSEYNDLENPVTMTFATEIKDGLYEEFEGFGISDVKVLDLREGSVIADVELTFNKSLGESEVDALLTAAAEDGKIGDLPVSRVKTGEFIQSKKDPKECNYFFEGEDCKKAKPALIALCVVGGVALVAIIVAIIACVINKKKSDQGSFSNGNYTHRVEPEGNVGNGERVVGINNYSSVNTGYEHEGANGQHYPASETPMVTFKSPNPAETPGIAINDSSITKKSQPGEGTYADLGDFHQKSPSPTIQEPVNMPPSYEKTEYAEISQFLRGPVKTDEEEDDESNEAGQNHSPNNEPSSRQDNDVQTEEFLLEI